MGADVALFPEMWNIGYTEYAPGVWGSDFDPYDLSDEDAALRDAWQAQAVGPNDPYVVHFRHLARELEMAIAVTYLERWPGAPRNSVSLIDRHGDIVLTYAKVHTCEWSLEAACTPGNGFPVATLETAQGEVEVGAMICYDREQPESARILMLKGAEIILVPNACGLEQHRLCQFRTRAYENMVGMAMANYAAPDLNGHSIAVDPIAFDEDERSRDTLIVQAGEQEGVYLAPFDLAAIRDYREREVWGNAYRKPRLYRDLIDETVAPPFKRTFARR
jgi:predicted amidohydrolase